MNIKTHQSAAYWKYLKIKPIILKSVQCEDAEQEGIKRGFKRAEHPFLAWKCFLIQKHIQSVTVCHYSSMNSGLCKNETELV